MVYPSKGISPQTTMKDKIQTSVESLANLCLENDEVHHAYTDKDLLNATLVFSHFLLDAAYSSNVDELSKKGMVALAETTGSMLRELIRVSTGLDMHELAAKYTK